MKLSSYTKRLTAPKVWKIPRKGHYWVTTPSPGPHPKGRCMPLGMVLRDMLGLATTMGEAKKILAKRYVHVDGKVRRNYKYPVGLMDVVSIHTPSGEENYRMLYDVRGKLALVKISEDAAVWKLVRIENKVTVKKGKIQLNFHDGKNMVLDSNMYRTGDVLRISLPDQKVLDEFSMTPGNIAMIIGGKHTGKLAHIEEYRVIRSPMENIVTLKEGFETTKNNVFVVGKDKPVVAIPEGT